MPDVLIAETGREIGSRSSGRLRREGKVPGVVYGLGMEPVAVAIHWVELRKVLAESGTASPVRIAVGGTEHLTVIRELQRHPVRRDVLHLDFYAIDPDLPVTIAVPLVLAGLEEGDEAADIMLAVHEIEITAKPNALPSEVEVDAAAVREAGSLTVADLQVPGGVEVAADPELVVVTIVSTEDLALEEETEEDEAAEGEEGAAEGEGGEASASEAEAGGGAAADAE
jgi:large subunit ribosomal protein L25